MRTLLAIALALLGGSVALAQAPYTNFSLPAQLIDTGTKFTLSGTCTSSASSGGTTAGTITASSAGNCTFIVTLAGITSKNGWVGVMWDQTQPTVPTWGNTSSSTTTITYTVPAAVASSDVLAFAVLRGY